MVSIYDVDANLLIEEASKELKEKKILLAPEWSVFVKTGVNAARPPIDADWWYARGAAILRKIDRLGPIGVNKLKVQYGGRKRRGARPAERRDASGNHIRKILQQFEKAGFIKKVDTKGHKGRAIAGPGRSFLSKVAEKIAKEKNVTVKVSME